MVRTAVTLAMLVPLLMPPGVCICHVVVPVDEMTTDGSGHDGSVSPAHVCAPCGERDNDDCPCPSDRQHPHAPCCPVLKFVSGYGLVKPENPATGVVLAHVGWAPAPETAFLPGFSSVSSPELGSPAAPLFLTLRTLRI
jgi:hypothetical protein